MKAHLASQWHICLTWCFCKPEVLLSTTAKFQEPAPKGSHLVNECCYPRAAPANVPRQGKHQCWKQHEHEVPLTLICRVKQFIRNKTDT